MHWISSPKGCRLLCRRTRLPIYPALRDWPWCTPARFLPRWLGSRYSLQGPCCQRVHVVWQCHRHRCVVHCIRGGGRDREHHRLSTRCRIRSDVVGTDCHQRSRLRHSTDKQRQQHQQAIADMPEHRSKLPHALKHTQTRSQQKRIRHSRLSTTMAIRAQDHPDKTNEKELKVGAHRADQGLIQTDRRMKQILGNVLHICRTFAQITLLLTFRNKFCNIKATLRTILVHVARHSSTALSSPKRANRGFENSVFCSLFDCFFR